MNPLGSPLGAFVFFAIPAVLGMLVGSRKGHPVLGTLVGLVLSYLGVVIVALWKPSHEELVRRERARQAAEAEARQAGPR